MSERFADRLKHLRALRGMSLKQVADAAGCVKTHVWELEKGTSDNPSLKLIEGLGRALSCDPAWLAGWIGCSLAGRYDACCPIQPK